MYNKIISKIYYYTGILAILINEIKQLKQNIKDTRNTLFAQNSAS